ncbi:MAG: hypothetical protein M3301_01250, partial [Chloroflexota bacterium]|nr:hypothetical protein [Chloroflexota bacterium]
SSDEGRADSRSGKLVESLRDPRPELLVRGKWRVRVGAGEQLVRGGTGLVVGVYQATVAKG